MGARSEGTIGNQDQSRGPDLWMREGIEDRFHGQQPAGGTGRCLSHGIVVDAGSICVAATARQDDRLT